VTVSRRAFLKTTATVAGTTVLGGLPGILQAGQAPAYAKGTKLHYLMQLHFIPATDKVFMDQAAEFGKQIRFKSRSNASDRTTFPRAPQPQSR
jgi:hypothetical protein